MAEPEQKTEVTTERAFRLCIDEDKTHKVNVVRVELRGIARFACWWFVVWSIFGGILALASFLK
ncbi:MAG: hypothetical protein ABSE45_13885 [Candidatus Acidiferrales bacterium]|jgi:hypothetical protein